MTIAGSTGSASADMLSGQGPSDSAATRAELLQSHISAAELQSTRWSGSIVDNAAFVPARNALAAHEEFSGKLAIGESVMAIIPMTSLPRGGHPGDQKSLQGWSAGSKVHGRDPALFPETLLDFFTLDADLVPVTQDVLRSSSLGNGLSFWDIIVQPGQVWSEPGDDGWSRGAFPFALVNSRFGSTHNGLALFLYRGNQVSNLRYQIVQQTASSLLPNFCAAGSAPITYQSGPIENVGSLAETHRASLADRVQFADWSALAAKVGPERLKGFDATLPFEDGVTAGVDCRGTFYLQYCRSAGGSLPWWERARFGVQSVTKVLACETALLRLAQKYGPGVFDLKIRDYVPAAAAYPEWESVRFEDGINMATGFGNGSLCREPNNASDGYDATLPSNSTFYEARSKDEKIDMVLKGSGKYPWGPNEVTRYRDQDMFILGVAMDNYLKEREGPGCDIWSMLENEVFKPIGIHYAPTSRTIETDGSAGHPILVFGFYPTISDIVKIARLYQSGGRAAGTQILYSQGIEASKAGTKLRGFPTGRKTVFGETTYFHGFWETRFRGFGGRELYVPAMRGYGNNVVILMPHDLTAVRLAKNPGDEGADLTSILTACEQLAELGK